MGRAIAKDEERQGQNCHRHYGHMARTFRATAACKDMSSRGDARNFCVTLRPTADNVRWHARFASNVHLTLSESHLVLSALARLADREPAAAVGALERTFAAHGRRDLAEALLRWR
jgi:hypothetical protein